MILAKCLLSSSLTCQQIASFLVILESLDTIFLVSLICSQVEPCHLEQLHCQVERSTAKRCLQQSNTDPINWSEETSSTPLLRQDELSSHTSPLTIKSSLTFYFQWVKSESPLQRPRCICEALVSMVNILIRNYISSEMKFISFLIPSRKPKCQDKQRRMRLMALKCQNAA